MHLNTMDLNLLKVFDAVMRTRNITRAARQLGLSQPAVSKAVGRLRLHLKDPLFIRAAKGMQATARAQELAAPIRQMLNMLEETLDETAFDPKTSQRTFRIITVDLGTSVMLARLAAYMAKEAPNVNLRLYQATGRNLKMLDRQEADFAFMPSIDLPERFGQLELDPVEFVLLMRQDHPLAKGKITLERYAAAPHLLVSITGDDRGFVDDILEEKGLRRRVAMTIGSFATAASVVGSTNMVLAAPRSFAQVHAQLHNLALRNAPFESPKRIFQSTLVWNKQLTQHPAHDWFRNVVQEIGRF